MASPIGMAAFTGNPAMLPLIASNPDDDVLLVQIAPLKRDDTPTTTRDILSRVNEISFSSSLAAELRALEYVGRHMARKNGKGQNKGPTGINVHRIMLEGFEKKLGTGTRLKTNYDFFALLHRAGRRAARRFLDQHFDDIGETLHLRSGERDGGVGHFVMAGLDPAIHVFLKASQDVGCSREQVTARLCASLTRARAEA